MVGSRHLDFWKDKDGRQVAKARWVAVGHTDSDLKDLTTYSPIVSGDSWMLCLQVLSWHGWTVELGDISSVFMNGEFFRRQNGAVY